MKPDPPLTAPAINAVVLTGSTETHYRRAGSGPLVLLLSGTGGEISGGQLFRELSEQFRVIAPRMPAAAGEGSIPLALSSWLRDLIDGLGLVRPHLVAEEAFGIAALRFAMVDPERVGRLVIVCRDHTDPAAPYDVLSDVLEHSGIPLLLLRADAGVEGALLTPELLVETIRFLSRKPGDAEDRKVDEPPEEAVAAL